MKSIKPNSKVNPDNPLKTKALMGSFWRKAINKNSCPKKGMTVNGCKVSLGADQNLVINAHSASNKKEALLKPHSR